MKNLVRRVDDGKTPWPRFYIWFIRIPFKLAFKWYYPWKKKMNEYRVTRGDLYKHDCIGHNNVSARQGHYFQMKSVQQLKQVLKGLFPNEKSFTYQEIVQGQIETTIHKIVV